MARTSVPRVAGYAAAALTLACLAGCAGAASSARSSQATASSAAAVSTGSVSAPAGPGPFASDATDRKLAASLAANIQRVFAPPPGSRKLSGPPPGTWRDVSTPGGVIPTNGEVLVSSWWKVPGQPQAVLKWLFAHTPHGWYGGGRGSYGPVAEPGGTAPSGQPPADVYSSWNDTFVDFHEPAVITMQQLIVEEIQNGAGQVYTRVDSLVTWDQPRPADDRVPAAAKLVTITAVPMTGTAMPHGSPATVTDPAAVTRIASLLNGLYSTVWDSCAPLVPTNEIRLDFRATAGGPVLATALVDMGGCRMVQFTVPGAATLPLYGGNGSLPPAIMSAADLNWFR